MESLHVAAGVITNADEQVLIALRHNHLHQGGLWEFPGGKLEAGENAGEALVRELYEELGIEVQSAYPLITVNHRYPERTVKLSVFGVTEFSGTAQGREGQPIQWVDKANLSQFEFPAANRPIVTAARLPPFYAILDDADENGLMDRLNSLLNQDIKLIQARFKRLSASASTSFLREACPLCRSYNAVLMLNSECMAEGLQPNGLHLTAHHLLSLAKRPEAIGWLAASCHNLDELRHAERIGADFAVLAPVLPTPTHPEATGLGWERFATLTEQVNLPVYALGGLAKADLVHAQNRGGQGIAAIRAFLE